MFKECTKCNKIKHLDFFKPIKSKSNYSSWCKKCHSIANSLRDSKDRTNANKRNAKYKKTEKGKLAYKRHMKSEARKKGKYRYNHSEVGRAAHARWRSNRRFCEQKVVNDLTHEEWITILENQNYQCNICNIPFDNSTIFTRAERDHIIPLSKGKGLTKDNVQALCRRCNASKGAKILSHSKITT